MKLTIRIPVGNRIITGNHVKTFENGVTVEDQNGVVHYVSHDRVIDPNAVIKPVLNTIVDTKSATTKKTSTVVAAKPSATASNVKTKKRWMRDSDGTLKGVPHSEVDNHLANGYRFSGPRAS